MNSTKPQILLVLSITALAFCVPAWSQSPVAQMRIQQEVKHDTSPPLSDLREMGPLLESTGPITRFIGRNIIAVPEQQDPVLQTSASPAVAITPSLSFEGLGNGQYGFTVHLSPPDTNGAVGATQYVQWVNASFAVFDKNTGALLHGPVAGNTLWAGFGGPCETDNDGDVLAQYDKLAGRWVMSQLAFKGGPPFFECVAVSTTSDATGTYHRYAFKFANLNDYPKIGIWPDAYYFSFNMFDPFSNLFKGADACAMNRNAMLKGAAATMICFQQGTLVFGLLPSDLDGTTPPPAGEPNFFINFGFNSLNLWKFRVDFATPANSTFAGPTNIPVVPFTPACNKFTNFSCVEQPGTTVTLDSLADRLMYRLSYRNFTGAGAHEALVVNHSVGTPSGIRWYEIHSPNSTPKIVQQGTFQPDLSFRWMGSIAMDHVGDIALGYSLSSSTVSPSIAITGRVPGDPPDTMEAETIIVNGTGSQIFSRWGDYSAMAVDPVDDCTFWYTQEYMATTGAFNWQTRIARFKFPNCVGVPAVKLSTASLVFPTAALGVTSAPKTMTVTNSGSTTLSITSVKATGNFAVKSTTCGATLAAGASCAVNVTFTPTAIGTRTGSLTVADDASTSPQRVSLSGTGTAIAFSPTSLGFGRVLVGTTSLPKSVTITNKSSVSVTFSGFALGGTNPADFRISSNGCGSTLAAGTSCVVGLTFHPTVIGLRDATLNVSDNGGGSPQSLNIQGTGTIVSVSPSSLSFGTVTVGTISAARSVTVANQGTVSVSFTGFSILGTGAGDFLIASNSCATTLAAGASCVVKIEFKPSATGAHSATLNISDNGGGSPQKVPLAGNGG